MDATPITEHDQSVTHTIEDADGVTLASVKHDNDFIVATSDVFDTTYRYVLRPDVRLTQTDGDPYTLDRFTINGKAYSHQALGKTGLPGERAVSERALHYLRTTYDIDIDVTGRNVITEIQTVTPEDFTDIAADNIDTELSLTLDNVGDKSKMTLKPGDTIYDVHLDKFYDVGFIHHRSHGAVGTAVEFAEHGHDEYRTLNLRHVDLKLHRGRWQQVVESKSSIVDSKSYIENDTTIAVGDTVRNIESLPGLNEHSRFRISRIVAIRNRGSFAVLIPENNLNQYNDLNVRAYPVSELITAINS